MTASRSGSLSEIEQFLELRFQCDAQHKRQLGRGVELPGLNGAYGIARHTHHVRQPGLGEPAVHPDLLEVVPQYKIVFHGPPQWFASWIIHAVSQQIAETVYAEATNSSCFLRSLKNL